MAYEVPVYVFVGFLESGKTRFIQETMEDPKFDSGDKTLLLVCEEGEEEYDPKKFAFDGVTVAVLEDKSQLNPKYLEELTQKSGAGRVLVEYNGMWMMNELMEAMPQSWTVYQCLGTADGSTIKVYAQDNAMRGLFLDKIAACELMVVNRAEQVNDEESRMMIHKLVRQASRRCDIAYEFEDGSVAYDDIPDPLPFDINAPIVEIADEDFGIWYMDCQEDPKKYSGKTLRFKAQVCHSERAGKDSFVPGRFAMTCCAADIQFVGFPCRYEAFRKLRQRDWVTVTAKLSVKYHPIFRGEGPVLTALSVEPAEKAKEDVVSFS